MNNAAIFGSPVTAKQPTPLEMAKLRLSQDVKAAIRHLDKISDGIDRVGVLSRKVADSAAIAAAHLPKNIQA